MINHGSLLVGRHFRDATLSQPDRTVPAASQSGLPRGLEQSIPDIGGHFGKLAKNAHVVQGPIGLAGEPQRNL
jgi:hypothetical protein